MRFIHRHGTELALPQMSGHPHARIHIARAMPMYMTKCPSQRIRIAGHGNDVHMIGHKAVRPYLDPVSLRRVSQQIEIKGVIPVLKERPLATIAALRQMMRNAGQYHAWKTGHMAWLTSELIRRSFLSFALTWCSRINPWWQRPASKGVGRFGEPFPMVAQSFNVSTWPTK